MQQLIKNWLLNNALFIALGISFLIAVLSLMSNKYIPNTGLAISDKFLHMFAYVVLIWSWLLVQRNNTIKNNIFLLLYLALFGIILEVLQGTIVINRTTDWKDIIANIFGLLLGLLSFRPLFKYVFK